MSDLEQRVTDAAWKAVRAAYPNSTANAGYTGLRAKIDTATLAAIRATIEALAEEAESEPFTSHFRTKLATHKGLLVNMTIADWLRAHLDAGRDGEATDGE